MASAGMKVELVFEGKEPSPFRVTRFAVDEALSAVSSVEVVAVIEESADPEDLLDRRAELHLGLWGTERRFQGLVTEADVELVREDVFRVRVVIAPELAVCALGRRSRIFQDLSVKEIVSAILREAGVEKSAWNVQEAHPKRPFVLQHQESDLAFVCRLLAEEGMGFTVDEGGDGERLSFFDDSTRAAPIDGKSDLYDRDALQAASEATWEIVETRAIASDAVVVKDYDMRRPRVDLTASRQAPGASGREVYLHPGGFLEEAEGKRRAGARLDALRASSHAFRGRSSCARLRPGRTFTLQSCANASANRDQLIVAVRHRGFTQGPAGDMTWVYENEFDSIPADIRWRPQPAFVPARGLQLAVVTVPPGQEIHCDEYGRVKVRFLWERAGPADDRSSHWLRVAQLALGGSLVLPRNGFEVLVDFEQGNLDRPFVAGHLYNGESKPPYELPAGKTRGSIQSATTESGSGANELRFEDSAGNEEIFFNASKDMAVTAHDNATESVGNDRKVKVGASRKLVVAQDHSATVKTDRKLSVAANLGLAVKANLSGSVGGSESVAISGLRKIDVGGDKVDNVKGDFHRKVGAMQATTAIQGFQRQVVGSSEVTVAGAWAEMVARNRQSSCGGSRTETTGAVKLVRAKQMDVSATKNMALNALGVWSTKCGGNRSDSAGRALVVSAASGLSVKAENIVIEAKSSLELRAGAVKIKLASGGEVKIKAPNIDLRGVDDLTQLTHRSG